MAVPNKKATLKKWTCKHRKMTTTKHDMIQVMVYWHILYVNIVYKKYCFSIKQFDIISEFT